MPISQTGGCSPGRLELAQSLVIQAASGAVGVSPVECGFSDEIDRFENPGQEPT
jgi:hypothetical protein